MLSSLGGPSLPGGGRCLVAALAGAPAARRVLGVGRGPPGGREDPDPAAAKTLLCQAWREGLQASDKKVRPCSDVEVLPRGSAAEEAAAQAAAEAAAAPAQAGTPRAVQPTRLVE